MAIGTVKWWNDAEGYGFIEQQGGEDVFVHHTLLNLPTGVYRTLTEGQRVEFEVTREPRGLLAHNVRIVDKTVMNPTQGSTSVNFQAKALPIVEYLQNTISEFL